MKCLNTNESSSWMEVPALTKCVTVRDEEQAYNKNIRLMNCEDSYIYIDSPINSISLTNCLNCTIVVAAVRDVCTIDKCEKSKITIASNFV